MANPQNPGLAAAVLGITEKVVAEHYRKGSQAHAAIALQDHLKTERARTKPVADREFGTFRKLT
jgi:hypothetical protein